MGFIRGQTTASSRLKVLGDLVLPEGSTEDAGWNELGAAMMDSYVYRLRPIENLLDKHEELANLEIFFSTPEDLNDPMEGLDDVVWEGDEILWENLLRHYVLALMMAYTETVLQDEEEFDEPAIVAQMIPDDLWTDSLEERFRDTWQEFIQAPEIANLPALLSGLQRPIRKQALQCMLSLLHPLALRAVVGQAQTRGLVDTGEGTPSFASFAQSLTEFVAALSEAGEEESDDDVGRVLTTLVGAVRDLALRHGIASRGTQQAGSWKKSTSLFVTFPLRYVDELAERLLHPPWRVACFSRECTNASMWARYAGGHTGAALMLRVQGALDDGATIELDGVTGWQGNQPQRSSIRYPLSLVAYGARPPRIDFFRSIATIPLPKVRSGWHTGENGEHSPTSEDITEDLDSWRNGLQETFQRKVATKLEDWKHEEEVRIVLQDWFGTQEAHPKYRFDPDSLAGIVFGAETRLEDKIQIVETVIENHLDDLPSDFRFYEMVYSAEGGTLDRRPIYGIP